MSRQPVSPHLRVRLRPLNSSTATDVTADLVGPTTFTRGADVGVVHKPAIGTAGLVLMGDAWTPIASPLIREWSVLRIEGRNPAGQLVTQFHGHLNQPTTGYDRDKFGRLVPFTTLPALDAIGVANIAKPSGALVGGTFNARLGAATNTRPGTPLVQRTLVGADDAATGSFSVYDPKHTMLDQLAIVAASKRGRVWADSHNALPGRLLASVQPLSGGTAELTLTDDATVTGDTVHHYTGLSLTHTASDLITGVDIEFLAAAGSVPPGTYGTWRDDTATAAGYARRDETVTVTDADGRPTTATLARDLLRTQPLPDVSVKRVTIDALANRHIFNHDLLYARVAVKAGTHAADYYVSRETHRIAADRWFIDLELIPPTVNRNITIVVEDPPS